MAADTLSLGGRVFTAATETTFEQDTHFMALVQGHRIHEVVESGGDVVGAVLRSGCVTQFLAATLVEVGRDWTPAAAAEWARHFAGLRVPAEKAALHDALQQILIGFFAAGGKSSPPSPTSSTPAPSSEKTTASPSASSTTARRPRRSRGPKRT